MFLFGCLSVVQLLFRNWVYMYSNLTSRGNEATQATGAKVLFFHRWRREVHLIFSAAAQSAKHRGSAQILWFFSKTFHLTESTRNLPPLKTNVYPRSALGLLLHLKNAAVLHQLLAALCLHGGSCAAICPLRLKVKPYAKPPTVPPAGTDCVRARPMLLWTSVSLVMLQSNSVPCH